MKENFLEQNSVLQFRRATIYSNMSEGSDKLKVRVLPDHIGNDPNDLPIYPMFDKTMVIHGAAEEDTHDPNKSTLVWVICTKDLLNGFIFCEANIDSYLFSADDNNTWPYETMRNHNKRVGINVNTFNYKELKVLFNTQPYFQRYKQAGIDAKSGVETSYSLDIINIRTGERWFIQSSGTCLYMGQGKIVQRVGSPEMKFSIITQTPSGITLKAKNITLDAEHLCLGHHGGNLAVFNGKLPVAVDGQTIYPAYDVTC